MALSLHCTGVSVCKLLFGNHHFSSVSFEGLRYGAAIAQPSPNPVHARQQDQNKAGQEKQQQQQSPQ